MLQFNNSLLKTDVLKRNTPPQKKNTSGKQSYFTGTSWIKILLAQKECNCVSMKSKYEIGNYLLT